MKIDKKLLTAVHASRKYIVMHVAFNWAALVSNIVVVITIGILLQHVLEDHFTVFLALKSGLIILMVVIVRFFCHKASAVLVHCISSDVKKTLRRKLYMKLIRLGIAYKEKISTSEVVQLGVDGIEQMEVYCGRYLPQLFYSVLAPLTLFVVISFFSFKTAAVLLLFTIMIPVSIILIQKLAKRMAGEYWNSYADLGETFLENLQGLTVLKIYNADERKNTEMNETSEGFRRMTMRFLRMQLNSIIIMDLIAFGGAALGVIMGLKAFSQGHLLVWQALTVILLSAEFFIPLRLLGSLFHVAMNGIAASGKMFDLLEMNEDAAKTEKAEGTNIRLEHLNFSYDDKRLILKDISMDIPPGSFISIVGESGSGKSTIAALMTGLRTGYTGRLSIGGKEVHCISNKSLMSCLTIVNYDSYIFKGTVSDNLIMGKMDATEEEMLEVLRQVNLYDFIISQQGLMTPLEEKGSNLSGGQRQRLALARAILYDSDIYIFDEATSNIDAESEASIMSAIYKLSKRKKTIILISHRLANVIPSECIYVLDQGKIVERGTHMKLLDKGGYYARLYNRQNALEQYGEAGEAYA